MKGYDRWFLVAVGAIVVAIGLILWSPWDGGGQRLSAAEAIEAGAAYMVERYGEAAGCESATYYGTERVWLVDCRRPAPERSGLERYIVVVDDRTSEAGRGGGSPGSP